MGCAPILRLTQRAGQPNEEEEEVVQDSNHSDHSIHVSDNEEGSQTMWRQHRKKAQEEDRQQRETRVQQADWTHRIPKVKLPPSSTNIEWERFNRDVDSILNVSSTGGVDKKKEGMATIMYNVCVGRYGVEERKQPGRAVIKNRRQREIAGLRRDLKQLPKMYRAADEGQRPALAELSNTIRENLKI